MTAPVIGVSCARGSVSDGSMRMQAHWASEAVIATLRSHGGIPMLLPVGMNEDSAVECIEVIDALVLTGGNDVSIHGSPHRASHMDPVRDSSDALLARAARDRQLPILGICRGMQLLVAAAGGRLHAVSGHAGAKGGISHPIATVAPGRFAEIVGAEPFNVNTFHRYAVAEPGEYREVAWADDGVVEAVEHPSHWEIGIQWHPELDDSPASEELLRSFVARARRTALRRHSDREVRA